MGFVTDFVSDVFGGTEAANASREAASIQSAAADKGIDAQERSLDKQIQFLRESRDTARSDLQPYREAGASALPGLTELVTDPAAQAAFVKNNPFFDMLAKKSSDTLFANQAARGKVGSGGTAEALQNSLFLIGSDLLNQNITQRQNLVSTGANAAAGQASATQNAGNNMASASGNTANTITNLIAQQGNAQASGAVGAANAKTGAINNAASTGLIALALSDIRAKEDIKHVGFLHNGLPVYTFRYKGEAGTHMNVMAQDVEEVMPEAVIEHNGLKYVDMERVCH